MTGNKPIYIEGVVAHNIRGSPKELNEESAGVNYDHINEIKCPQ